MSSEFLEDGTVISRAEYQQGQRHGKSYYFDHYAKVGVTSVYNNGNPQGESIYESKFIHEQLIAATANGDLKAVQQFLSKGAKPNELGETSSTVSAVFKAAEFKRLEILDLLISKGGDINGFDKYKSRTPLMAVVSQPKTVQHLLSLGADPRIKNTEGITALHEAIRYGYLESAELLVSKGADVKGTDKQGKTLVQIAEALNHKDKQKIIELLSGKISAKTAVDDRNLSECKEKMKSLARYIEVNKDKWEDDFKNCPKESYAKEELNRAFQRAAQKGLADPMNSLLKKGAELNSRDQGYQSTPLMLAAREGKIESVEFLLKKKAEIDTQDNFGKTALMYAVQWAKNKNIVKLLLDNNANASLKNKDGLTAKDLAKQGNLPEIESLLAK